MIEAFKKSLMTIARKPHILAPAIVLALVMAFAFNFLFMSAFDTLTEFALENRALNLGFFEMIIAFYKAYWADILFFTAAMAFLAWLNTVLLLFYSKAAMHYEERDSLSTALKYMLKNYGKALALVVFLFLFGFLAAILFFLVALFFPIGIEAMAILLFGLVVIFAIILIRLFVFAVPAMVFEGADARESISFSWQFSGKKFPETIILTLVAFFCSAVITSTGLALLQFTSNDIFSLIVSVVFNSLIFAFTSMLFAFYYFDNPGLVTKKARHQRKRKK